MEPTAFITRETLGTFAGQVLAVGMLTQMVKASLPEHRLTTYRLRALAVLVGIAIHAAMGWSPSQPIAWYVLAVLNGTVVSMVAMNAVERVKGDKKAAPPAADPAATS